MFCNYCGAPLADDEDHCPICGKPAERGAVQAQPQQAYDPYPGQSAPQQVVQRNVIMNNSYPQLPSNRICNVALAFGIVGLILTFTVYFAVLGLLFALAGLPCAIAGLVKSFSRQGSGRGKAIAGLVLTAITLVLFVFAILLLIFVLSAAMY